MINDKRMEVFGVPVIYPVEHEATAMEMAKALEKTISVIGEHWKLGVPKNCDVRVLTDLEEFIQQTVPKQLLFFIKLTRPFWLQRTKRAFDLAGGWMLPWPGRLSVGVKPPELLARSSSELGKLLFVPVPDSLEKVRHLLCHEFTHACTAHLRFPPWLNEGLAMRAVDHMAGYTTVLEETRSMVQFDHSILNRRSYRRIKPNDYDRLIRLYATGYWITRQLEKEKPSVLFQLLERKRSQEEVARIVGGELNLS